MATQLDATTSLYYLFNEFITYLKANADLPKFSFASTTSIEATSALLDTSSDKLIVMQNKLEIKNRFTTIVYNIIPSFSKAKDLNALLTAKVFSAFEEKYKRYSSIVVYESQGLESAATTFIDTGCKLIISNIEQEILGAGQFKNNFNSLKVTFIGYLD